MHDTNLQTSANDFVKNCRYHEKSLIKSYHNVEGRGVFLVSKYSTENAEIKTMDRTDYLKVTKAATNKGQIIDIQKFVKLIFSESVQVLDQNYLDKIKEMEVRIVLIKRRIILIVVFTPVDDERLVT